MTKGPGHIIIGRNSVRELLRRDPSRIKELRIAKNSDKDARINEILSLAEASNIKIFEALAQDISKIARSESHQGVLALCSDARQLSFSDLLAREAKKDTSLLLFLDGIEDPHNLGAILRAAECFGIDGVIWSKNRGASISPAVTKVSAGASELLSISLVSNLATELRRAKDAGYWVVATELGKDCQSIYDFDVPTKTALVLGGESKGVSKIISELSDFRVMVPMYGSIDSLNVSQAAAVFLSYFRSRSS